MSTVKKNRNRGKKRSREETSTQGLNIKLLKQTKQSIESVGPHISSYKSHKLFIGTSGYSYPSWHKPGSFYPKGMRGKELVYYMQQFNSVELNYPHYRIPSPKSVASWKEKAEANRPEFLFVVKVNMWFTHMKLINVDEVFREKWERFWTICQLLEGHRGPLLFQFPARLKYTAESGTDRLRKLHSVLSPGGRYVFEFRDASWYCHEVYQLFREFDWCLCRLHLNNKGGWAGSLSSGNWPPDDVPQDEYSCSWGVYFRYHGTSGQYEGLYGPDSLIGLREERERCSREGKDLFVYFNNTDEGLPASAIQDAIYLTDLLNCKE